MAIAPETRMGPVELSVADLERSLDYYRTLIGLEVLARENGTARLGGGGGSELLVLDEQSGAEPSDGYTGLFHFALLVPERADLARWLAHGIRDRVPLTGLSDHYVSEAIYLRDPDHHGIEIYADRPRELWEGQVGRRMTTLPLDVDDLVGELGESGSEPFDGLPGGTVIGHVHLKAAEIPPTTAFYRDVLGFEVTVEAGSQAVFLAAGGYHHHLGANVWETRRREPAPPTSARLLEVTIVLPDAAERDRVVARLDAAGAAPESAGDAVRVVDPSGIALRLDVQR